MPERIEPAGQQVGQRHRHDDADRFGDLRIWSAVRGQARQPRGDQAGQRGEHLVHEALRLRSPAPSAVPDHLDGTPADGHVSGRGRHSTVILSAVGGRPCTKTYMFQMSPAANPLGPATTVEPGPTST